MHHELDCHVQSSKLTVVPGSYVDIVVVVTSNVAIDVAIDVVYYIALDELQSPIYDDGFHGCYGTASLAACQVVYATRARTLPGRPGVPLLARLKLQKALMRVPVARRAAIRLPIVLCGRPLLLR